jgi:hypothetical protein
LPIKSGLHDGKIVARQGRESPLRRRYLPSRQKSEGNKRRQVNPVMPLSTDHMKIAFLETTPLAVLWKQSKLDVTRLNNNPELDTITRPVSPNFPFNHVEMKEEPQV